MSSPQSLLRGDELNLPRPCNPSAVRQQLAELCRGHGVEVRMVWSVDLNRCAFGGRIWKKYGLKTWRERLLGHLICVADIFGTIVIHGQRYRKIRYDPPTRMLSGAPAIKLPGEIALPDMILEENVFSRWILEWRVPDAIAKPQHARQRYAVIDGKRVDALGEFPPEGWWKCFMIIGDHGNGDCCRYFEPLQVLSFSAERHGR